MAGSAELARRRAALLARGEWQRARLHQQAQVLHNAGARFDRLFRLIPRAATPPVLAGAAALLVMVVGRQRSLRLAAGALGLWATVQRLRQLGSSLGLLTNRHR